MSSNVRKTVITKQLPMLPDTYSLPVSTKLKVITHKAKIFIKVNNPGNFRTPGHAMENLYDEIELSAEFRRVKSFKVSFAVNYLYTIRYPGAYVVNSSVRCKDSGLVVTRENSSTTLYQRGADAHLRRKMNFNSKLFCLYFCLFVYEIIIFGNTLFKRFLPWSWKRENRQRCF